MFRSTMNVCMYILYTGMYTGTRTGTQVCRGTHVHVCCHAHALNPSLHPSLSPSLPHSHVHLHMHEHWHMYIYMWVNTGMYRNTGMHVYGIVVPWLLKWMRFVWPRALPQASPLEVPRGGTIPCTSKAMVQLTCSIWFTLMSLST